MLRNYLLIAIRNLQKHRAHSLINIVGLAAGMAVALVIGIWTVGEFSVDRSYPGHDRIAEIMQDQRPKGASLSSPFTYRGYTISSALKAYLQKGYNEIFTQTAMSTWPDEGLMVNGDKSISRQGSWAEYTFPIIFGYHFLSGTAESLRDPSTALISRSAAITLFGSENAVGKTFRYNNQLTFTIGGVYADQPKTSSFHDIDFFVPMTNKLMDPLTSNTNFDNHNCRMFVRLAGNTTAEVATARIKDLCRPFVKHSVETYTVLPFERLYLHYDDSGSANGSGRIGLVRLLGIIGVFVLLLACINFMNLSTARSGQRAKEVGIRKTMGSYRGQLITQFLGESLVVALLAFLLAIGLTVSSLPWFSSISGTTMTLPWTSPIFWILSLAFTLLTGLLAGSYPAFYLSGFRPVKVLKGDLSWSRTYPSKAKGTNETERGTMFGRSSGRGTTAWPKFYKAGRGASLPRKILVVAQFSISLSLIIGTVVVFRQVQFGKDRPVGYDRTGLINVPINTDSLDRHYESLRTALLNTGVVANMTSSSQIMTSFDQNYWLEWAGMGEAQKNITFRDCSVNPDFGPTLGWMVLQGRDFSRAYPTDSTAAIVNEEGARILGFNNPIGKTVRQYGKAYTIIGVTKNMLVNNPYEEIQPAIFFGEGGHYMNIIRIKPGADLRTALATIESVYKKFNPASPFIFHFNDEGYEKKFLVETRIGNLAGVFAGLAIFISCLGLFGLASFAAEQRTKELGVRKVLGAGVFDLWALLSKDFLGLVVLSMFISMPLVFLGMHKWLEHYTYRTALSWWIFASAGFGLLVITLLTVSFQSLKAALMNPVRSLRSE